MFIEAKEIVKDNFTWILRCPTKEDAAQLSSLRLKIDGETEFLDREPGEHLLSTEEFEKIIAEDLAADGHLFLVVEVNNEIVGFSRCIGNDLRRFRHKAEFGICILQDYCGYGMGKVLLENVLKWADDSGLEKITLTVVESNTNAIHLYQKFGFKEEGLLRKDRIHRDGNYYNTVIMSRFKD